MEDNVKKLRNILYSSKQFSFEGTILKLQGYYSGERIELDLSVLLDYEDIVDEMVESANDDEDEW